MIGCSVLGYTRSCAPTVGGAGFLWVGDANDFDFTSGAADANGDPTGYSAVALRAFTGDTSGQLLYAIDSLEDTINVTMTQANADGSSSAWTYNIIARMAQFSQAMTVFNQKIDAAAACCQLVYLWANNDGTIFVAGEKYVDGVLLVPKFKLRQDGSKIDIGKKFTDFNGEDLSIKGDYSRPAYQFTGGIAGLTAFLAVST